MEIDEAILRIEQYKKIVDKYVPENKVNTNDKGGYDSYLIIRGACIEALAILDGDEEIFKKCLEETKKKNKGMGWGFDFDMYNAKPAADYILGIAHLMKR